MWHKHKLKYLLLESGLENINVQSSTGSNLGGFITNQLLSSVVNVQVTDFIGRTGTSMFGAQPDMKITIAPNVKPNTTGTGPEYSLKGGGPALVEVGIGGNKGIRIGRLFVMSTDNHWFLSLILI